MEESIEAEEALELFGAIRRLNVGMMSRKLEEMSFMNGESKTDKHGTSTMRRRWCSGVLVRHAGSLPRAIRGPRKIGHPTDRISYYRGGMQLLGLTRVIPGERASGLEPERISHMRVTT
jgi:hypothetical protein